MLYRRSAYGRCCHIIMLIRHRSSSSLSTGAIAGIAVSPTVGVEVAILTKGRWAQLLLCSLRYSRYSYGGGEGMYTHSELASTYCRHDVPVSSLPSCHSSNLLTITFDRSKRMSGSFDMDAPGYGMHQSGFCESTASDSFKAHAAMQATHIPTHAVTICPYEALPTPASSEFNPASLYMASSASAAAGGNS